VDPRQTPLPQTINTTLESNRFFNDVQPRSGSLEAAVPPDGSVAAAPQPVHPTPAAAVTRNVWPVVRRTGVALLAIAIFAGGGMILLQRSRSAATLQSGSFDTVNIPFDQLEGVGEVNGQTIAINGRLVLNDAVVVAPSMQPADAVAGQLYYDQTANELTYYNGTAFIGLSDGANQTIIQNNTNNTTNSSSNITNVTNNNVNTDAVTGAGGTAGKLPKFTGVNSIGDSIVTDNGSNISVSGNVNLLDPPTSVPEVSIWPTNPVPEVEDQPDAHAPPDVELGVKFRADVDGVITGIRFYKGSQNTGTHTGSLWTSGGALLSTATFTDETASGWQQVRFSSPIAISADTTYVASYHTASGFYSISDSFFTTGVDNAPLHALQDGVDGPNGVFRYSLTPAFPNLTFSRTNYWVDVLFRPGTNQSKYQINGAQISSADLINNADLAKRSASQIFSGSNIFKKNTDASIAFSIQTAAGNDIFTADTLNGRVYIGPQGSNNSGVVLVLGMKTSASDPVGVEGGIYYNDELKTYRCYRDGAWTDCADKNPDRGFALYDEFLGGDTATGTIGNLGWSIHDIGGTGSIAYDPGTPTPTADRPGVLAITTPASSNQGTTLTLAKSGGASMVIGAGNTIKTAVAVGAATNQVLRVGLHTQTTATTQPVSGVWWEADPAADTHWRYCYGNGSAATCTASGVLIAADSWVRLEIRVTATGSSTSAVTFLVNGAAANVSGVTIDTAVRVSPALSCYTTNGTAKSCYWDYYQVRGPTSAAR
jgi:hypothetical protein